MKDDEKEITLEHNGYTIKLKIKNDYNEAMEAIKKKLYFQEEDLKHFEFYYIDEDDDQVPLEEDLFDESSNKWRSSPLNENEKDKKEDVKAKMPKRNLKKISEKIKKNINEAQENINTKVKEIKEELISKFTKIAKDTIIEISLKYEEKIKKLEDKIKSLIEQNKSNEEEMEKIFENLIETIVSNVSQYAENKINSQLDEYNSKLSQNIKNIVKVLSPSILNNHKLSIKYPNTKCKEIRIDLAKSGLELIEEIEKKKYKNGLEIPYNIKHNNKMLPLNDSLIHCGVKEGDLIELERRNPKQIYLKTLAGEIIKLYASPNDTIYTVKYFISLKEEEVYIDQMRLILNGIQLENNKTLKEYNIKKGEIIYLTLV